MNKKEKRKEKRIDRIWTTSAIISILATIAFAILFLFKQGTPWSYSYNISPDILGQYGDLIGGLVGTLLAGVSAFLIYMTYKSQKEELKATQDFQTYTRHQLPQKN